ncbi:MAG: dTDP-4-dehydrorhamnose 3,5-epimerase [Promethearchaeota archaeon]
MKIKETNLDGLYIIKLEPIQDERGRFQRIFCKDELNKIILKKNIVQINHSITKQKGTVRGLHFQFPPKAEIKIITCLRGSVFDVSVDLRKNSPTFLKWHSEILSSDNKKVFFIPEGYAHGFQTLEENSELLYLHTEFYSPENEGGIRYDDPKINIEWPIEITLVSKRDKHFKLLNEKFQGLSI